MSLIQHSLTNSLSFGLLVNLLQRLNPISDLPHEGGVIQREGGERRACRAKEGIPLVSSFLNRIRLGTSGAMTYDHPYAILRLLLPHRDRERGNYGIKDVTLAKIYCRLLEIDAKVHFDAKVLVEFKSTGLAGDVIAPLTRVLGRRFMGPTTSSDLPLTTIGQVNGKLDELVAAEGKLDSQVEVMRWFFNRLSIKQQIWLAKIILKADFGRIEGMVLKAFHPDAKKCFEYAANLSLCAEMCKDFTARVQPTSPVLFYPFLPQLCARCSSLEEILRKMDNQPFWIQTKMDGYRILMHYSRGTFQWFTRNGNNYQQLPGIGHADTGALSAMVEPLLLPDVEDCILDGEIVEYDENVTGNFAPFGGLLGAMKSAGNGDQSNPLARPNIIFFDIVYLNGKSLLAAPLTERYKKLKQVLTPRETFVEISPYTVGNSIDDLMEAMDNILLNCQEGIIIKDPRKPYTINERRWLKLKPEMLSGLSDTFDVVIVGGYYGSGSLGGKLSSFLCAIRNDMSEDKETCPWVTFCEFGSGIKRSELDKVSLESQGNWKTFDRNNPPTWLKHPKNSYRMPDKYIDPLHSHVVSIKASDFTHTRSSNFGTWITLRFPRLAALRDFDKGPEDTELWSDMMEQSKQRNGRISTEIDSQMSTLPSARKKAKVGTKKATFVPKFPSIDASTIKKTSNIFEGKQICILDTAGLGSTPHPEVKDVVVDKAYLTRLVAANGGRPMQLPSPADWIVVADSKNTKVVAIERVGQRNVLRSTFILDCVRAGKLLDFHPSYMLVTGSSTKQLFERLYDSTGDSFATEFTDDTFHEWLASDVSPLPLSNQPWSLEAYRLLQEARLEYSLGPRPSSSLRLPLNLFENVITELDEGESSSRTKPSETSLAGLILSLYGGFVQPDIDAHTTHVICGLAEEYIAEGARFVPPSPVLPSIPQSVRVVSVAWVVDSFRQGRLVNHDGHKNEFASHSSMDELDDDLDTGVDQGSDGEVTNEDVDDTTTDDGQGSTTEEE